MGLRSVRSKEIKSAVYDKETPDIKKYCAEQMMREIAEKQEEAKRKLEKAEELARTRGRSREVREIDQGRG